MWVSANLIHYSGLLQLSEKFIPMVLKRQINRILVGRGQIPLIRLGKDHPLITLPDFDDLDS